MQKNQLNTKQTRTTRSFWPLGVFISAFLLPLAILVGHPRSAEAQVFVPIECLGPQICVENYKRNVERNLKDVGVSGAISFDSIAWAVAKIVVQQITSEIVDWINSGFDGNPAFVTDPDAFFLNIADETAGRVLLKNTDLAFLCSPFALNIKIKLATQLQARTREIPACKFSDAISNVNNFLDGDWLAGGWQGWFEVTQTPTKNPYGAFLQAQIGLFTEINNAQTRTLNLLDWGDGFLSWGTCPTGFERAGEECVDDDGNSTAVQIQNPGKVINEQLNKVLGSSIDQLNLADEFQEIIGALAQQLLTQVFTKGLRAASNPPSDGSSTESILQQLYKEDPRNLYQASPVAEPPDLSMYESQISGFTYSLAGPTIIKVNPGTTVSAPISKILGQNSGTPSQVSLSFKGASNPGISVVFSNGSCTPDCVSTAFVSVAPDVPVGQYTVSIAGTPASGDGDFVFVVDVTNDLDVTPPNINSFMISGLLIEGSNITVTVDATDDFGIDRVEFVIDGALKVADSQTPYSYTEALPYGQHTITARVYDLSGQSTSQSQNIFVDAENNGP